MGHYPGQRHFTPQLYINGDEIIEQEASLDRLAEAVAPDDPEITGANIKLVLTDIDADPLAPIRAPARRALEVFTGAVNRANAEAQGYIEPRYGGMRWVQWNAQQSVKTYVSDIARYHIYGGDADSKEYRGYKVALAFLKDVAAGKIDIDLDSNSRQDHSRVAVVTGGTREFDDATWSTY